LVYKKKSWKDKLNNDKDLPRVVQIEGRLSKKWGSGTCVIPSPKEVNQLMRKIPKGKLVTINQIRETLAKKHKAKIGCPITTGIFARIAAGAAEEEQKEGRKNITPYWRTLKQGGVINEKYPGGVKAQKELLEKEGHKVKQKGKKYVVENFKEHLAKI
jgi:alkylated DNA nucleotide flippase Atl1